MNAKLEINFIASFDVNCGLHVFSLFILLVRTLIFLTGQVVKQILFESNKPVNNTMKREAKYILIIVIRASFKEMPLTGQILEGDLIVPKGYTYLQKSFKKSCLRFQRYNIIEGTVTDILLQIPVKYKLHN